jgi:predicted ester cyclase
VAHGADAIRDHVASVLGAFSDLTFDVVRAAHGEDFTAAEWHARMTHDGKLAGLAPTGRTVESAGVDVATIGDDGRITHLVSYYDGAAIMRGLGLLPAHGSRTEAALVRIASLRPRRS